MTDKDEPEFVAKVLAGPWLGYLPFGMQNEAVLRLAKAIEVERKRRCQGCLSSEYCPEHDVFPEEKPLDAEEKP